MPHDKHEREIKRAREACVNCRRKKTRCPGGRPSCAYCFRLGQVCEYASDSHPYSADAAKTPTRRSPPSSTTTAPQKTWGSPVPSTVGLGARVSQLEAQLRAQTSIHARSSSVGLSSNASNVCAQQLPLKRKLPADSQAVSQQIPVSTPDRPATASDTGNNVAPPFTKLPPAPILEHLVDVYFLNCHCQPYSFFHEGILRRQFLGNEVPAYLQLAIACTAVRYSQHEFYKDNQTAALRAYARSSWLILLERFFASDHHPDVAMAQATALLAVTDFVAGHHHVGWVKIGLAIRLVQDLKLGSEPNPTLSAVQREETRRTFWSIYILDKLFACSRTRPVSILDSDCKVALPCSEESFRQETPALDMPTLAALRDLSDFESRSRVDEFAGLVVMCSTISRCTKSLLQSDAVTVPIWDPRSTFSRLSSFLMSFETMHIAGANQLETYIAEKFGTYEGFDRQRAGHFAWARGIYHLCGVLLYHPLILYRNRQACPRGFPPTFAKESLNRYQQHLTGMTDVVRTVHSSRCCARGSFLGYLAACAGSLHKIATCSTDEETATQAKASLNTCLGFLEQEPVCWPNHKTMALAVRALDIDAEVAHHLLDLTRPATFELNQAEADKLLHATDYAWLSDPRVPKSHAGATPLDPDATGVAISASDVFTFGEFTFPLPEGTFNFDSPRTWDISPFNGSFDSLLPAGMTNVVGGLGEFEVGGGEGTAPSFE